MGLFDLFRKKSASSAATPTTAADQSKEWNFRSNLPRYAGKPLLRLCECWVLWCIGELPQQYAEPLRQMEPHLIKTWAAQGARGPWHEIIPTALHLPPDLSTKLRRQWESSSRDARDKGQQLTPQQFAEQLADWICGS